MKLTKIKIIVETENEAFDSPTEFLNILDTIKQKYYLHVLDGVNSINLFDTNGNKCGILELEYEEDENG